MLRSKPYEDTVELRHGRGDPKEFTRRALLILDTRVGRYRGYCVLGSLIQPTTLALHAAPGSRGAGTRLRIGGIRRPGSGLGFGFGMGPDGGPGGGLTASALSVDVAIAAHPHHGLRLIGLGPSPLPLRRGSVDAVRCATFVFGTGDLDVAGPTEEFGVTIRSDAGLACAYAYGTLQDPYAPRWEVSVRPVADVTRGRGYPNQMAVGQIAAHCLAR